MATLQFLYRSKKDKGSKVALKKVSPRLAGGIGLFLMAAEFAWCMSR